MLSSAKTEEFHCLIYEVCAGAASTLGDRPPINPAILVRFPPEADGTSFAVAKKWVTLIYRFTPSEEARAPSTGTKRGLQFSL